MIFPIVRILTLAGAAAITLPSAEGMLESVAEIEDSFFTYLSLAASALPLSELAPIFGGIAAHEGSLRLWRVILAISLGGWAGASALFFLGRYRWEWLRRKWPSMRSAGTLALRIVSRNPTRASFLVRFLFGARILLPIACGAARVPLKLYLPVSLLGSVVWTVAYTMAGMLAGEAAEHLVGHLAMVENGFMALGAFGALMLGIWWWRRRVRRLERRKKNRVPDAVS